MFYDNKGKKLKPIQKHKKFTSLWKLNNSKQPRDHKENEEILSDD